MNDTRVRPIGDQVLVRRDPPQLTTKSGIALPQGSENWPTTGTVLDVGSRVKEKLIKKDVRVFFKSRPASALIPDDRMPGQRDRKEWERVIVLREDDIFGIIVEE